MPSESQVYAQFLIVDLMEQNHSSLVINLKMYFLNALKPVRFQNLLEKTKKVWMHHLEKA